nr:hypothetical protein [Deltaproteobacteria bacterium]
MSLIRGRKAHTLFLTGRVLFLTVSLGFAVLAIMATPRMTLLTPSTQAPTLVAKGSNRTNDEGVIEWTQTFGGFDWDRGEWVEQTADGGYIITGIIDHADVWLIKTDAHGHAEWNQTYGGPHTDWGYCVAQTTDGGYIITGWTRSYGAGEHDLWLIKTDAGGNVVWNQTYGGPDIDYGYCVAQTTDGGYIITGSTGRTSVQGEPSSKGGDVWLIKTDADGNAEWTQTYGNPFVDIHDRGEYVEQTADGGYIITGCFMAGDVWLIKTDADG